MKLLLRQVYIICLFCIPNLAANAQQMWGMMGSNYAGVTSVDLNPSSMVLSKCAWDLNVVSFDAGVLNNSFYTNPQFIFKQFTNPNIQFATSNTSNQDRLKAADFVLNNNIQKITFVNLAANVKGPSFMYTNGKDAFAITTALRTGGSAFNLDQSIIRLAYDNLNVPSLNNQLLTMNKGVSGAVMSWLEIGGSYGRKIQETPNFIYTVGGSLKVLVGYASGYVISNGVNYVIPYRANFTATDLNMAYGHSIISEKSPISLSYPLGHGASVDLGVTIERKKRSKSTFFYACPKLTEKTNLHNIGKDYRWRLGVSIIDIGGISFSTNSAAYTYNNVAYSWDTITLIKATTVDQIDQTIRNNYAANGNLTIEKSYFIWTPTAASVQLDYNFNDLFYTNFSIIQRMVLTSQPHLARMNSIALTPRYETRNFEVAMPIILNEYVFPNIGLMMRYKFFFIGSDQIGSTLGFSSIYGFNVYAGIKINYLGRKVGKNPRIVY